MYINVVVKDMTSDYQNQLVFHFGENFEQALNFAEKILIISNYSVEILQFCDNKEEK